MTEAFIDLFLVTFCSMKLNSKGVQSSSRVKEHETWKNTLINKERDKLLHEFLLAREELKVQFDCEKRELVGNYERRLRYLRRVLEDCDENINMLKLNLDAEKEENFILKTKIMEFENEEKNKHIAEPNNHAGVNNVGYLNQSYDKESLVTSYPSARNSSLQKQRRKSSTTSAYQSYATTPDKSSIDGLKYSDRMASCGSFGPESCFTSVSTISNDAGSVAHPSRTCSGAGETGTVDLHANCRSEFNRLLKELRVKQERFDAQLETEKERMREQINNERIQLERVVYRQLNTRLDREIKKQDLLLTENAHLRRTISNAIMERMQCECRQPKKSKMVDSDAVHHHNKLEWKESNSDSGADVRSDDDGSDSACDHDSGKGSMTYHDAMVTSANSSAVTSPSSGNDDKIFQNGFIEKFIYNDFQHYDNNNNNNKAQNSMKNINVVSRRTFKESPTKSSDIYVQSENEFLKEENQITINCLKEVEDFKHDLIERLVELEAVLTSNDDGEC